MLMIFLLDFAPGRKADRVRVGGVSSKEGAMFVVSILYSS